MTSAIWNWLEWRKSTAVGDSVQVTSDAVDDAANRGMPEVWVDDYRTQIGLAQVRLDSGTLTPDEVLAELAALESIFVDARSWPWSSPPSGSPLALADQGVTDAVTAAGTDVFVASRDAVKKAAAGLVLSIPWWAYALAGLVAVASVAVLVRRL